MPIQNKIEFYKKNIYRYLHEDITEFSLLEKGACNNIYLCKTVTGKLYCLKEERFDKLDREINDIITEANIIKLLDNKSIIFTPKISFILKKNNAYCYEYIKGGTLDTQWDRMTEKEKIAIMKNIGKYHAELHNKISIENVHLIGIKRDNRDFDTLISNIIVRISKIDKTNKLYTAVLKMQKYYKKAPQDRPTYGFLHGDLHKGNILVYESKLIGIVDLGKSIIGDIHKDFSHHMRHYPEYIDIIIESYENETGVKLSKNKIIFYAFLKDMEKLIYHLDKYEMHTKKMVKKVNLYNNLLTN